MFRYAAAGYRRNKLKVTGGGLTDDRYNREEEYLRSGQMLLEEWRNWFITKKIQLNGESFVGETW